MIRRLPVALLAVLALAPTPAWAHPPASHRAAAATPAPAATAPATPRALRVPVASLRLPGSGVPLYALRDGRLPRVWWHLNLEAGERFVPTRFAGLSTVAADVLDQGPATMTVAAYRSYLFRRGAEISWEAGNRFLTAHVKCQPAQLAELAAMVRRTVREPRLGGGEFERSRERVLTLRKALDDDMRQATFNYGKQKLWEFRPEARLPDGWPRAIAGITQADAEGWMRQRLGHPAAFLAAAGPVAPYQLAKDTGRAFAGWLTPFKGGRSASPTLAAGRRVVLIDKPGATDNQIYFLSPYAVDLASPEAAAAEVYFAGMGRDLGSRLGNALRVVRGLTYGANAGLRQQEWPSWYFYSFGGMTQTPQIVAGAFELFAAAAQGLTDQEVARAKDQLTQDKLGDLETPPEQIAAVGGNVALGLPPDLTFRAPERLAAVTTAAVKGPAAIAGGIPDALIVVMGDASKLREPLAQALPAGTIVQVKSFAEIEDEALTGQLSR